MDVVSGESCDSGPGLPTDTCSLECQVMYCGNGLVEGDEVCDDGNNVSGDGCSPDCASTESCGNGYLDALLGEQGVDGNTAAGDGCGPECLVETCGNGYLDPGEVCDDGNLLSADGCSGDCRSEEWCGNGVVDFAVGEQCTNGVDDDNDGLVDCADPGCGGTACGANGLVCFNTVCACPGGDVEQTCDDSLDNDCDGLTDCDDPDCDGLPCDGGTCSAGTCQ